jgi:hypothetical protein
MGLPVLRTLSLCTCCRHYPGAATGRRLRSSHPAVSAFPENVVESACTSAFSRLARRSLTLRPAHSRRHLYVTCYTEGFSHFVTSMTAPVASGWSVRRVGLAPTGKRRLSRRTRIAAVRDRVRGRLNWAESRPTGVAQGTVGIGGDRAFGVARSASHCPQRPMPNARAALPLLRSPAFPASAKSLRARGRGRRGRRPRGLWIGRV